jgi:hypothetical protein
MTHSPLCEIGSQVRDFADAFPALHNFLASPDCRMR